MHLKKSEMPRVWPIQRKGKRYVAVPSHAYKKGISVLFILRDMLKIVETRKEAKYMTLNGFVKVNNKIRKDENFPVQVFGTVSLEKSKKNYRLEIFNRKFRLAEISAKEAETKIIKITGKTIVSKGRVQMNLDDGQNFITKTSFSVGDSVLLNTLSNKVEKILPLKKGAKIEVIKGKHAGQKGELVGFVELTRGRDYLIKLKDGQVSLPYKTILVIG